MQTACVLALMMGYLPLVKALRANRRTTIFPALIYTLAAWTAWVAASLIDAAFANTARYLALSLSCCAGIAVLGARRPGVGAWNFVLLALLAVLFLPLAESLVLGGALPLAGPRAVFLAATLLVIVMNYLPTALGPAAVTLGMAGGIEVVVLALPEALGLNSLLVERLGRWLLACVPCLAWVCIQRRATHTSEFDVRWLDFRDRFGVVWAQRVCEQFNRSAANTNRSVILRWRGLRIKPGMPLPTADEQGALEIVLRSLLKRFEIEETGISPLAPSDRS